MKKIRLCDGDLQFFDMDISPGEFKFFQKHRDAFRCMWKEQDKPFWKRFIITFRSFTVKHGIIKQISCDTPKFENILDEAFIFIHEQFVDGKETMAKNFIEDTARLAQNQDKLQYLNSKSFAKDPFYIPETREVFRRFFGPPNQKASLLKVYILSPVYLRFGGSICRCLNKWIDAPIQDPNDDSYWIPPMESRDRYPAGRMEMDIAMCTDCREEFSENFFREKISGISNGPRFIKFWTMGDPRFNDDTNPLYSPNSPRNLDWREELSIPEYLQFCKYVTLSYAPDSNQCKNCELTLGKNDCRSSVHHQMCKRKKNKKKKKNIHNRESNEIEKLVDHINGKVNIASPTNMGSVKGAALSEANSVDVTKVKKRRRIFSSKARITDEIKCGIAAGTNLRGSFKVYKIQEADCFEMIITVAPLKNEHFQQQPGNTLGPVPDTPLSSPFLRSKIKGLPELFEWWEGKKWSVAVLNYELEEKNVCPKPTNFSIKITGVDEDAIKRNMLKFLFYIAERKRRYCPGWFIAEDDVVTCIFPDEYSDMKGLTICIQKGFRFEERMSEEEKSSLQQASDQFIPKKKKTLMTLETEDAKALYQGADGREKMRELMIRLNGIVPDDCVDEILPISDGIKLHMYKGSPPIIDARDMMNMIEGKEPEKESEESIWDQMEKNPESFCLFVLVDTYKTTDLAEYGLKALSLKEIELGRARKARSCSKCYQLKEDCTCNKTELASDSDLDNDHNGVLLGNEQFNIKKANPDWCSDAEQKVTFPTLYEPVKKSDSYHDLPPLVDGKSLERPVGTASIFPATGHDTKVVDDNAVPDAGIDTRGLPSLKVGELTSGVQIGITLQSDVGPQVDSSTMKNIATLTCLKNNFATNQIPSVQNIGPSQLKNCIAEARSTVSKIKTIDGSVRMNQISVKVATLSVAGKGPLHKLNKENAEAIPLPYKEQSPPNPNGIEVLQHLMKSPGMVDNKGDDPKCPSQQTKGFNIAIRKSHLNSCGTVVHIQSNSAKGVATHVSKVTSGNVKMTCTHHHVQVHHIQKSNNPTQGSTNATGKSKLPCPHHHHHHNEKFCTPSKFQGSLQDTERNVGQQKDQLPTSVFELGSDDCTQNTTNEQSQETTKFIKTAEKQEETTEMSKEVKSVKPIPNIRICAKCGEREPIPKKFKKCQRCKTESVTNARYYCGRDCQVADWNERHKTEHKEQLLS